MFKSAVYNRLFWKPSVHFYAWLLEECMVWYRDWVFLQDQRVKRASQAALVVKSLSVNTGDVGDADWIPG